MDIYIFESAPSDMKESSYIPLNVMSEYSMGESILKIDDLIQRAKSLNMKALALTDRTLAGALEFYLKCKANDIKPIIGQKVCFSSAGVILLCKDFEAYKILCKYSLELDSKMEFNAALPFSEEECKHFICITEEYENQYLQKVFGPDLYAEKPYYKLVADGDYCEQTLSECGLIPAVITNEVHFLDKTDAEVLRAFATAKYGHEYQLQPQFYFADDSEILLFLEKLDHPELLENIQRIIDQIPYIFPDEYFDAHDSCKRMMENLPYFEDGENLIKALVEEGVLKRNLEKTAELTSRIEFELNDIIARKWTNLFLMHWEITSWCRENNIAYGPGRGAAGGSLVAYLLQITDTNPLEYSLFYERFVNPDRITYPDFDIDYDYEHLDDIIEHLKDKYGKDNVVRVATYGRLSARTALIMAGKALGFSEEKICSVLNLIPTYRQITIEKLLQGNCYLDKKEDPEDRPYWYIPWKDGLKVKKFLRDKKYKNLINIAKRMEGLISNQGLHASGYIITKEPVWNYTPVLIDSKTGESYCEYSLDKIDFCGLYKNDILGLMELSKFERIKKLIKDTDFNYHNIPLDDAETIQAFAEGNTEDVFYFESLGMQEILREFQPEKIEDLIALRALYRPGPMDFIPAFIESKLKPEIIHYPDPSLEDILEETYGVVVYQEQLMLIAQRIAGYTLGQADMLRRAMGRKQVELLLRKKQEFVEGAIKRGFTEQNAEIIYEILIPFSGYVFNKSHAVAYTKMAFWDMYLKVHFPKEYEEVVIELNKMWDREEED